MAGLPPPDLNIPPSSSTVNVSVIDTTTQVRGVGAYRFLEPSIKGHEYLAVPAYSFLIRHPKFNRTLIYDLGMRKDWWSNPVLGSTFAEANVDIKVDKSVREILEAEGVDCTKIESIVWSHWHFDHTGNVTEFEKSTSLIVGPGFKDKVLPGYPTNPESYVLESDWEGRELIELDFSSSKLKIGKLQAVDFFGDGSYYFLNTPGHTTGHISALARVTSDPPSFIFMGGDAYHHGGEIRPSPYLPLPESISPNPFTFSTSSPCPGHLFEPLLHSGSKTQPFYIPSAPAVGALTDDAPEARRTIEKLQEADVRNDILMVVAHDENLLDVVEFFPKSANGFVQKGWVEKARWRFLKDFKEAIGYQGEVVGGREWGPPRKE